MTYYDELSETEFEDLFTFVASLNENPKVHIQQIDRKNFAGWINALKRIQRESFDTATMRKAFRFATVVDGEEMIVNVWLSNYLDPNSPQ